MARMIKIRVDEVTCRAVLHDDAPTLGGLLWNALPLTSELRHVRWSGEAGYLLADGLRHLDPPDERRISMFGQKQVVMRPEHAELAIAYGQGQARDATSRGTTTYHIASLIGDADPLLRRVAETRHTGLTPIEITRVEGD